jgi:hypothetical protein
VPILERTDFIQMHIDVFMGTMMSTGNKVALLGPPLRAKELM